MLNVNLSSHSILYLKEILAWALKCCRNLQLICNEHISLKDKCECTMWEPDWGISYAFFDPWRCLGLMLSSNVECQLCKSVEVFLSSLDPLCLVSCCLSWLSWHDRVSLGLLVSPTPIPCLPGKLSLLTIQILMPSWFPTYRKKQNIVIRLFLLSPERMKCRLHSFLVALALLICIPLH